jgi:hypothetical protein
VPDNKCPECGRQLPKGHSRCLPCDDLRYQVELENPTVSPPNNIAFTEGLAEIAENRKARKAEAKKAQLDSAFAWGSAIGAQEVSEDYSYKSLPDSFCSECGVKLPSESNFCASCGKKRNGTDLSSSITNQSLYPNRKKSKSSVWVVLLILLVLAGVGYGVYGNILSNGSSNNNPQDYDVNSVDTNSPEYITGLTIGNNFSDFSDAGSIAEEVCATARDRRIVLSSRGGIGVDPKTATFLNSEDGFQGCIDGFNGVPQD